MKKLWKIRFEKGIVYRDHWHLEYKVWQKGLHIIKTAFGDITVRFNYGYTDKLFKTMEMDIIFWKKWWPKDFGKKKPIEERGEEYEES